MAKNNIAIFLLLSSLALILGQACKSLFDDAVVYSYMIGAIFSSIALYLALKRTESETT